VLRFRPSFAPESQILISKNTDGTTEILRLSLPEEKGSVADHIERLVEQNVDDPAEIAKRITVERTVAKPGSSVIDVLLH